MTSQTHCLEEEEDEGRGPHHTVRSLSTARLGCLAVTWKYRIGFWQLLLYSKDDSQPSFKPFSLFVLKYKQKPDFQLLIRYGLAEFCCFMR